MAMASPTSLLRSVRHLLGRDREKAFPGSAKYWETRYSKGGNSGNGSYGELAAFKAEVLNAFISEHGIQSVIEFGCGDGNQLGMLKCPSYVGVDVSETVISACRQKYASDPTKRFMVAGADADYPTVEMAMSLDVIYHLVEDSVFTQYMRTLFDVPTRFVVLYSSNGNPVTQSATIWPPHMLHREITAWAAQNATGWKLASKIPNRFPYERDKKGNERGSFADFYFYTRV